jgi:aspartyl-tRNA(Asn)/glutamyl-tRNA(Gln) amidotransferase subunit A
VFYSLKETIQALHKKQVSSVELTQYFLKRIADHTHLNAFISINESALDEAKAADKKIQEGKTSNLTGIPLAHKDLFCTQKLPTSCGSKMLANFQSPYPATLVKQFETAGTVLLGKTNMDEFAMGASNQNSYFGPVKNPWNTSFVSGGSSGGSAAAVSAGLASFATGSDTGGSIRQPAAFCGISGLKPTYGLVSRFGMVAYASSLDQAGPMAQSAEDLALILEVMAGPDPKDSTCLSKTIPKYSQQLNQSIKKIRIGLPSYFFQAEVDSEIQEAIKKALQILEQEGAEIIPISLSLQPFWVPCYYLLACAEASSNLARYDGIRFGYRSNIQKDVAELIIASRTEGFGEEVKKRILTGTYVLSSGYYDAYYLKALKTRRLIQQELLENLKNIDCILSPTTPTCAFELGKNRADPMQEYLADVFTVAANLAGLPALSIPVGFSKGLPIGMQLIGKHFSESRLLQIAHQYQQLTKWHTEKPTEGAL